MLAAFANAVLPKSVLHALHAHDETHCEHGVVSISAEHTHCDFLQLQLAAYNVAEQTVVRSFRTVSHLEPMQYANAACVSALLSLPPRGPPVC